MSMLSMLTEQRTIPEKYVTMSINEMEEEVRRMKNKFGQKLYIPGHHYQKDEVIQFADDTGDSLQLAQLSAQNNKAEFIIFCGVHFMAETADILTTKEQIVILPDLRAGCSMADMADIDQTERAWKKLQSVLGNTILPLTYVNSTAEIKAFCGRNGGATVTSSNARKMIQWAFSQKERIMFLPDQHLGRNTAYDLGIKLEEMAVWDPFEEQLECAGSIEKVKVILWKGHCSVHEKFTVEQVNKFRGEDKYFNIIVHPECTFEVVQLADYVGSTNYIIDTIQNAPKGSKWAVGTEMNLVNRLSATFKDKTIVSLNPNLCPCLTMNRIDLAHLVWSLHLIEQGEIRNQIKVEETIAKEAYLALKRMFQM